MSLPSLSSASRPLLTLLLALVVACLCVSSVDAFYYNFYSSADCSTSSLTDSGVLDSLNAVRPTGSAVCTNTNSTDDGVQSYYIACSAAGQGGQFTFSALKYDSYQLTAAFYPNVTTCPASLVAGLAFPPNGSLATSPLQPMGNTTLTQGACVPAVDTMAEYNGTAASLRLVSGWVQVDCSCMNPIVVANRSGLPLYACNDSAVVAGGSSSSTGSPMSASTSSSSIVNGSSGGVSGGGGGGGSLINSTSSSTGPASNGSSSAGGVSSTGGSAGGAVNATTGGSSSGGIAGNVSSSGASGTPRNSSSSSSSLTAPQAGNTSSSSSGTSTGSAPNATSSTGTAPNTTNSSGSALSVNSSSSATPALRSSSSSTGLAPQPVAWSSTGVSSSSSSSTGMTPELLSSLPRVNNSSPAMRQVGAASAVVMLVATTLLLV